MLAVALLHCDRISISGMKLMALIVASKSLWWLFCPCCNDIRMSTKHIEQMRIEWAERRLALVTHSAADLITEAGQKGQRQWDGEDKNLFSVRLCCRLYTKIIRKFYHFEDPSQGSFAVSCTGLLGFGRLWLLGTLRRAEHSIEVQKPNGRVTVPQFPSPLTNRVRTKESQPPKTTERCYWNLKIRCHQQQ